MVINKGEDAFEMFIIYSGEVGVYTDSEREKCVAVIGKNRVFGETALERNDKRGASIVAHSEVKVLVLNKIYYRSIVLVSKSFIIIARM